MSHKTIAVIGHVDHGKTALVKALTGVDTDTLKEEKDRGLSIALGFANRVTQHGQISLIDAPGHADFVKATASGISGADAVLLAVSAADGIQAQTEEHVKLAHFFGIRRAIVALTKSDLADASIRNHHAAEIGALLAKHGFQSSPIISSSSVTGDGLDALIAAIEQFDGAYMALPYLPGAYLPIDRVFTSPGAGTIVTGTLLGDDLHLDTQVRIEPTGRACSIRGLQISGEDVASAPRGARVAVNLRNVQTAAIKKGNVLCEENCYARSKVFDVALDPAPGAPLFLKHMEQVTVLFGTSAAPARLRLFADPLEGPAAPSTYAQLEFSTERIAYAGQHLVIRRPASAETLAGGLILDPNARLVSRKKTAHIHVLQAIQSGEIKRIAETLAERDGGAVEINHLGRLARQPTDAAEYAIADAFDFDGAGLAFHRDRVAALKAQYCEALTGLHAARPCRPLIRRDMIHTALRGASPALLAWAERQLADAGRIQLQDQGLTLSRHDPATAMTAAQRAAYQDAEDRLHAMGLQPGPLFDPSTQTSEQADLIDLLVWTGLAIRLFNHSLKQDLLLHTDSVDAARRQLNQTFAGKEAFTTGEARQALSTNRKTIVPLLEYFDHQGITSRNGDLRQIVQ